MAKHGLRIVADNGYTYEVNTEPIPEIYPRLVVEALTTGAYWIMQVDNIHDIDQEHQFNILATNNPHHAIVCGVPLLT